MRAIMVMYDSLNRHLLPPYGCNWTHAPNFSRLAERSVTFDRSYVCSMPCMPARRDLHTGRPNFLHRAWGPIEPFDESIPEMLKRNGVYTHLSTDHYHYFEEGGCTYHTRFSSWESFRGQEGDPWYGVVEPLPPDPRAFGRNAATDPWHLQDWTNRRAMPFEHQMPQAQTFMAGLDFLRRNQASDRWFLQIETFDPHEPFFSPAKYKDLFASHYDQWRKTLNRIWDWPGYQNVSEGAEMVEHMRHEYASLMAMCDTQLGMVMDTMDELSMWDDTMLIVCTDHGFLLGEHDCWAKCWMPFYEEVAHTPFFVWDPRSRQAGVRRKSLVQPSIDLGPTLLDFFGMEPTEHMTGKVLAKTIAEDEPVREYGMFGLFGAQVNLTDGKYVYMRGPAGKENQPLAEYTLMPTRMRRTMDVGELQSLTLADPFSFTQGCRTLRIPVADGWGGKKRDLSTLLFDVEADPRQEHPIDDPDLAARLDGELVKLMKEVDSPLEQYQRLGLPC